MNKSVTSYFRFDEIESQISDAPNGRMVLFSQMEFQAKLEKRLNQMLQGDKILSLDVFDTLIFRDNSSELTRFYEIGGMMAKIVKEVAGKDVKQIDAFIARQLGTQATYRASKTIQDCREGSLEELHATASYLLVGDASLTQLFIKAELRYEATRLHQNFFLIDYVRKYRAAGGRVILISDMYMHGMHISDLLNQLDIVSEDYDLLLSSSDTKVSKASGGLFKLAESEMGEGPEQFFHLGDSLKGDVVQPIRSNWKALHLPISEYDIMARRNDHLSTYAKIQREFGLTPDVAIPH